MKSAYRERWPDLSLTAAIMPRGKLEPMWAASVGLTLPIYWWDKGSRAVDEAEAVRTSEQQGVASVRQLLALRTRERHTALAALVESLEVYRHGLLVQSDATVRSTASSASRCSRSRVRSSCARRRSDCGASPTW